MPVAPSFDDFLDQFESEAQAVRATLRFDEGTIPDVFRHGAGAMADLVLRFAVQALKETFIDGARGAALTQLVSDHLGIDRFAATRSTVTARFARVSGGAGGSIPIGTTIATLLDADGNEVRFTTDAAIVVGAGVNGPFDVAATATITGPSGNVSAGRLTRVIDPLFDTFTVTNLASAGGGNVEESDRELRVRARNFWQTLRRGTIAAIEFGALQVASVRTARAIENETTGALTLVVGDSEGNSTAQMVADVEAELENWRAAGVKLHVAGSSTLVVDVVGTLDVDDGVDPAVIGPLAEAAIESRMRKQRQGESLHLDSIKAAAIAIDPDGINALNLTTPIATVTPSAFQAIRPGTISIT